MMISGILLVLVILIILATGHYVAMIRMNRRWKSALEREKKAEVELQESEERYRLLVELSPEAVVVHSAGQIVYINNAGAEIFGASSPGEMIGKPIKDFVHPDSWGRVTERVKRVQEGSEQASREELVFQRLDGQAITVETSGVPILLAGKRASLTVIRDITEQLKTEKQLFQAQKMEAIGTMAGGIAHDFNNILGAISGYTEISLEKIPADSRIKHYLEQIQTSCQRAINLVRQILEFSRLTEKERRPVSLTPLIKETFKMLREIIPTTIDMRLNTRTDTDRICGDATQIYQILMNLCTNAYQAMKDKGGLLAVDLAGIVVGEDSAGPLQGLNPGSYLELTVRDTGGGIDPLVRERIFDPFFTTKKIGEGTGLGLSVVHGIVSSYGGKITVESRIGAGSAFHVYLPLLVEKPEAPVGEPEQPDWDGRGRILLVDDEPMLADVTREMLENRGYTVVSRTGSLEALETFRAAPDQFDLVITDQTMPEMTGIDLAENVISIRPGMPVILCTGFIDAAIEEKTTKIGIGAIVLKPVSMKRLISLIRNLLAPVR